MLQMRIVDLKKVFNLFRIRTDKRVYRLAKEVKKSIIVSMLKVRPKVFD